MSASELESIWELVSRVCKSHPWHGVPIGAEAPRVITAYIEIVPSDTLKYELDKQTGHLKVDRPQRFSNICPSLYGLIPRTCCGTRVGALCANRTGRSDVIGDGDPLDICVIAEKTITHGDVLLEARPIGGLRMIDGDEADDKIIAVMKGDVVYEDWQEIDQCPPALIERLKHYFLTYKDIPGSTHCHCEIAEVYGREEAYEVIRRSQEDYLLQYPSLEALLTTQT
ncbi:MAG: inorganic pyrophosphatase [Nitrospirales bacterium]|nr:MAG: inorganic pyrophosphatase [Nitrospirales bacterium]